MVRAHGSGPVVVAVALSALAASATSASDASASASAREMHSAQCVAALDLSTRRLAVRVKDGQDALRPLLLARLKSGAAFIGAAYVSGERDGSRMKRTLETALEAQKALSESEVVARLAACEGEGAGLLAGANALERAVISRVAAKQMQRLLAE